MYGLNFPLNICPKPIKTNTKYIKMYQNRKMYCLTVTGSTWISVEIMDCANWQLRLLLRIQPLMFFPQHIVEGLLFSRRRAGCLPYWIWPFPNPLCRRKLRCSVPYRTPPKKTTKYFKKHSKNSVFVIQGLKTTRKIRFS